MPREVNGVIDSDRHRQIADILKDRPFVSVRDLQDALGVSAATIRRDIEKLHQQGQARKVYGGISARDGSAGKASSARPYDENRDIAVDAKRSIARLAATLVRDGDAIIINAGSTCFHLGVMLAQRSLRVYTNSMPLAAFLGEHGSCQVILPGGELHREPGILASPSNSTAQFYASRFFVGAQGISGEGTLESHPLLVRVVSELSDWADEVVVLADSRKFAIRPRNVVLPLSRIGTLVTDENLSDADAKELEDNGVAVLIAGSGGAEQ